MTLVFQISVGGFVIKTEEEETTEAATVNSLEIILLTKCFKRWSSNLYMARNETTQMKWHINSIFTCSAQFVVCFVSPNK